MMRARTYGLFRNTKTKALNIVTTLVMIASTLSGTAPLFLSQKAFALGTSVTPTNANGWGAQDGTPSIVAGPSGADGNGSLKLTTDTDAKQNFFHAASTSLAGISGLGYKVDVTAGIPASYQLQVTGVHRTDSNSTFTSLVWEPAYNGQPNGPNGGFVTESNLENGTWWSSHPIAGDTAGNNGFVPLSQIIAANPDAQIVAYGVNLGSGTPNATSYVDDVSFQSDTANFELDPTLGAENFNTVSDSSYKGISVGFNAKNFSEVSAVTVTMTRTDGSTATMHGTQDLFDLIDANTSPYQFTAPFVIQSGSYSGDSYWTSDPAIWNTKTVPQSVTITVTGTNGTQTVTNSTFSQGAPSWPAYDSLVPPAAPTNAHFLTDSNSVLACGSTVKSIYNNKLQLVWDAGSSNSTGYRTLITYPDGGTKWAYTDSRNAWIGNVVEYGHDNGFGEHGNGIYKYEVQARNASNQWSDTSACTLAYDTQGPTAHFVKAPADGAHVNGSLTIESNAQDNVALKGLFVDVRTKDGSTWKAGCNGTPDYSADLKTATLTCTINTNNLVDGTTYMLRAHAGDFSGYGNTNADAVRYITIDRTLPTATISSPSSSSVVKGKTLTIKGSATDNADFNYYYCYVTLPGSSEVGVRGADCNTTWHSVTGPNDTLGTVDLSGLTDGNYEAHLVAYDKAGNHSDFNYFVPFTLDNTRPSLAFTAPADFSTPFKAGPTVTVHGSDANGLNALVIHVYSSANVLQPQACTATAAELASGDLSCNLSTLSDGTYYVKAGSNDKAGNNQTIQSPNFTVDSQRPNAAITAPANNSFVTGTFTISGTATDAQTGVDHVNVYVTKLKSDGSFGGYAVNNQSAAYNSVDHTFGYNVSGLTDGDYTVKAVAFDRAGNAHFANTVKVSVDNTGPSAPTATPGAGTYNSAQLVSLSSDDGSGSGIDVIYYTTDGSTPDQTSTRYVGAFLVSTNETVHAVAYDKLGNASTVMTADYTIVPASPAPANLSGGLGSGNNQSFQPASFTSDRNLAAVQHVATFNNPDSGDSSGQVLGASTTTPNVPSGTDTNTNGHVKGASTVNTEDASDKQANKFLGLGWWWLAVLAVLALVFAVVIRSGGVDKKTV